MDGALLPQYLPEVMVMTKNEQFQRAWHMYEKLNGHLPSSAREASIWGVQQGLIPLPDVVLTMF